MLTAGLLGFVCITLLVPKVPGNYLGATVQALHLFARPIDITGSCPLLVVAVG